jgi:hypothetical protein
MVEYRGGGNTRNLDLNRGTEPLVWMMNEAEEAGLKLDSKNLGDGVKRTTVIPSLTKGWWILEVLPLARLAYGSNGKRTIRSVTWDASIFPLTDPAIFSRPHLGRGRKISENHKIHYSVLANYLQVGEKKYQPRATYREPGQGRRKVEWEGMFRQAESQEAPQGFQLRWEGDRNMIEALRVVREVDIIVDMSNRLRVHNWLLEVSRLVSDGK